MAKKKAAFEKRNNKNLKFIPFVIVAVVILALLVVLLVKQLSIKKIEQGDTVTVDYTGYSDNGKIFDTTTESLGKAANLDKTTYEPLTFTIGDETVIPGFEEEILGLKEGEKKSFFLTPERAYGLPQQDLFRTFLRDINVSRYSYFTVEEYKNLFGEEPEIGGNLTVPNIPWLLVINDIIDDENVSVESALSQGEIVHLPDLKWETVVIEIGDETILLRQYPNVGDYISTSTNLKFAVITEVTDKNFTADANFYLAGKNLKYDVEIKKIEKKD